MPTVTGYSTEPVAPTVDQPQGTEPPGNGNELTNVKVNCQEFEISQPSGDGDPQGELMTSQFASGVRQVFSTADDRNKQSTYQGFSSCGKPSVYVQPLQFDCVIMPPDAGVDELLDKLSTFEYQRSQNGMTGAEIYLIQSLEDLSKDNLRLRIHLNESSGECERSPGKLFQNNHPIKLVIDLQKMSPSDTVALNDLLDPDNPTLNKTKLGSHVEILVLMHKKQLYAGNTHSLGSDTCRRLNRVENTWDYQKKIAQLTSDENEYSSTPDFVQYVTDGRHLNHEESEHAESAVNLCNGNFSWRQTLFGGYGVKSDRGFGWDAGIIEREKPKTLWMTGMPDRDLEFTQALRNIKITKEIEANGKKISLSDDLIFKVRQSDDEHQLRLLENIKIESSVPDGQLITINSSNINGWLSKAGIDSKGKICEHYPLEAAIQEGGSILITSSLTNPQWKQLVHTLKSISEKYSLTPSLAILSLATEAIDSPQFSGTTLDPTIRIQHSQNQNTLVDDLCRKHPEAEIVRINPATTLSQLVNNAHIISESRYQYGFRLSRMMQALKSNKPVILCGLEQNPRLQLEMETLFSQPGYFFINGNKEQIPTNSRIYLIWPEQAETESVLWRAAINKETVVTTPDPVYSLPNQRLQEQIITLQSAFATLPECFATIKLPKLSDALIQSVVSEATTIAAQTGGAGESGSEILPVHYRKAISRLVTHVTRENKQVRVFMKSVIRQIWPDNQDSGYWVDIDKLTAFLGDGHLIDRDYIASNSWELVDMFGEQFFSNPEPMILDYNQPVPIETLIALICRHAPQLIQRILKKRLECNSELFRVLPNGIYRSSIITNILHNALYSGWAFREKQDLPVPIQLANLSTQILDIQKNSSTKKQNGLIRSLLETHLIHEKGDDQSVTLLLDQILSKHINQENREIRRLGRLKERIQRNKLITLEGSTGTGKSYLAHKAAKSVGPTLKLTIGPSAEESQLLKRWIWQKDGNDRTMQEQAGIIMNWAKTVPGPNEFVTLIVDEANLAAPLLDNVLTGIWSEKPHIFCCSEKVEISPRHRVVFTCNPGAYSGRSSHTVLQDQGTRVHYPPLSTNFLREQVLLPALNKTLSHSRLKGLEDNIQKTADAIMDLHKQLKNLLPDRIFSPRDLTDVCSWIAWQLYYKNYGVSPAQLNAMVWSAFDSVIGHSLNEAIKEPYLILKQWFVHHHGMADLPDNGQQDSDKRLDALYKKFCGYAANTKPAFNTSSQSVKSLMQALAQDLDRLCLERANGVRHTGRRATLVEGPAGRGKDATLKLALDMWLASDEANKPADVRYLNAGDCEWAELKKAIREAQQKGKVLIVSELNLISSADLEGELNDVLTEPCAPGFHLFATTNPPGYSGRNAFSPALKDRFRFIRIGNYSREELCTIARQKLPAENRNQTAEMITALHCYIDQKLKSSGQTLSPVCRDLQNLASAVTQQSDFIDLFAKHYFLYLEAGKITKEELADVLHETTQQPTQPPVDSHRYDHKLCSWLFKTIPNLDNPLFIQRTKYSGYSVTNSRELSIDERLSDDEAKTEIIRQVAKWLWNQETGMPTEMGERGDNETQALYVMQQRQWFRERLKDSHVSASDVFKLNRWQPDDPQQLPVSAAHSEALTHLSGYRHILSEREIWERLLCGDLQVDINKTKITPSWYSRAKSFFLPVVTIPSEITPDLSTTSRRIPGTKLDCNVTTVPKTAQPEHNERTFYGQDLNHYRLEFLNHEVSDNGDIYEIKWQSKEKELIRVFPKKMDIPSKNHSIKLSRDEAYGCHIIKTGSNKTLFPLPSRFPREEITKLRTEPVQNYELLLDNYTGQHWIRFSGLKKKNKIQVHYQLSEKISSAGLLETACVDKVHQPPHMAVMQGGRICPKTIRSRIDKLFTTVRKAAQDPLIPLTNKQQLVLNIINAQDNNNRIEAAAEYCRQFDNESYLNIKPSDDLAQILLSNGVGACKHRAPVFKFILQYFDIICRVVESEIHAWAEVWDGSHWKTYDVGGASIGRDAHGQNPHFPEILVHKERGHQYDQDSLAVLAPRVIEHFEKANLEGIKQGCDILSTCKKYGDDFWTERRQITESLLNSLNKMSVSNSEDCRKILEYIENAHSSLDERSERDNSVRTWSFINSLSIRHLNYCIEKNVINAGWCCALTDFIIEKEWLKPKTQIPINFFENLRHWRWIEKSIPSLKTLASENIKDWYQLWKSNLIPFQPNESQQENLQKMAPKMDENITCTGRSETFETLLGVVSRLEQWTDQPEDGIADIGRLLQGLPAYKKATSGLSQKGKPLFIITNGFIDTRNQAEEIQTRFAHYLYNFTKDLQTTVHIGLARRTNYSFQAFQVVKPNSIVDFTNLLLNFDKLFALSDVDDIARQKSYIGMLEQTKIKKMMDNEDIVVIQSADLQKIYDEYIESFAA